ncbi:MAG TPA: DUF488 family protein [Vicinamibacterales bacterium]|nr:DUF488 family protein [Vicinamibacterales bacterium]
MAVSIVRLGSPRQPHEGIRFGTVRRPPRGVPKTQYAAQNWYDVWLPNLSPSPELFRRAPRGEDDERAWDAFKRRFRAELKKPEASHLLDALAALSHTVDFAVGCYCEDEQHCHRAVLRTELKARGARIRS